MKNVLVILLLALFSGIAQAQTIKFSEDFESLPIDFSTIGTTTWARSSALAATGIYSDSARIISSNDTASLISTVFSAVGTPNVYLEFDHICKIAWGSAGRLQVSNDSGHTWIPLTYVEYRGPSPFSTLGQRFTATSYIDWLPAQDNAIPQNSWWKHERFDISDLVGDSAEVMIRFTIKDESGNSNIINYGWLLDNVKVTVAIDELDPPILEMLPTIFKDTVYFTGPYDVKAKMTDASGIDTAFIVYTYAGITDTVGMEITGYDTNNYEYRQGSIPSLPFDSSFCYQVFVVDLSGTSNVNSWPSIQCQQVEVIRPYNELNVGLGSSDGYMAPMYNDSVNGTKKYSQHISLVKGNELNFREADFVKLAWNKADSTGYLGANAQLKIYMKHTYADTVDVAAGAFSTAKSGATLVFDSTGIKLPIIGNWIDFEFNTDTFHYDGVKNVLIMVEWHRPDTLTNPQMKWKYSFTTDRAVTFAGSTANPTMAYGIGQLPNTIIYSEPTIYPYDIGVSELIAPQALVIGNTAQDIKVRVKNYGSDTLTKMNIHYSLDGLATQTYPWTGSLNRDLVTNDIIIGSEALASGNHSILSWTSAPNDSNDLYNLNDTISRDFFVCTEKLHGTYTIGGGSADFQTFQEVENRLNNCGISASVTFLINPGVYQEHIHLVNVAGVNVNNTITFTSSTSNADDVRIVYDAPTSDMDYIFKLESTSWVRIKYMTLRTTNSLNSTVIVLQDSSQNNILEYCKMSAAPVSNGYSKGVVSEGAKNSFNQFAYNSLKDFGFSFILHSNSDRDQGNVIANNEILNMKRFGVDARYQDSLQVLNNEIKAYQSTNLGTAVNLNFVGKGSNINGNNIELDLGSTATGIVLYNTDGTVNSPILIANNFVSIKGASTANSRTCLQMNSSNYINVYHNSFALFTGGTTARTVYISTISSIELYNNIFSNFNNGYCFEVSTSGIGSISKSDYNSFYSNGAIYGKWGYSNQLVSSLGVASLTSFSSKDSNSVFTDPLFYSNANLHSFSSVLNDSAKPNIGITHDIDGDVRSISTPDIGADEFTISSIDAGVIAVINPMPLDTQARITGPRVVIRNFGSSSISSMQIKYQVNGGSVISHTYSGNLAYAAVDTVTLPNMTVPVLDFGFKAFTYLVGDTLNANDSIEQQFYGMPLIDIEVVELQSPVDGCDMDTNEIVTIKIKNLGLANITSGLTASYQIVGSSNTITESITTPLNAGATMNYTFNTKADLSVNGVDSIFKFKTFASHSGDPIAYNDTNIAPVLSLGILAPPTVSDVTINYGTSTTLTAVSPYNTVWYLNDTSTVALGYGANYTTPPLYDTTTYFVESNTNVPAMTKYLGQDLTTNFTSDPECIYAGSGSNHQMLILASELSSLGIVAGDISSISFYIDAATYAANHSQYTIKMGHTAATSLTTSFITSGLTQVYQQGFQEVTGWNLHSFTTPFTWDGTSNIIFDFVLYSGSYGNPLPTIKYSATGFNSVAYIPGMGAPGVSTKRPNMRLTTDPVLGCAGSRSALTVNVPLAAIEANMAAIISPNGSCGLDTTMVECRIINMGTDTMPSGSSVSYQISNGAFSVPEVIATPIAPKDTLDYIFNALAYLPSGPIGTTYSITAAISTPNDFFGSNDTVTRAGIWSEYTPNAPVINATPNVTYGNSVLLSTNSPDSVYWYHDLLGTNQFDDGTTITIGPLFDTTVVYAQAQKTVPLSPFDIGNGTAVNASSTGPSPFGGPSYQAWGVRNQFLIRASEMRAMGMLKGEIESLAFNVTSSSNNAHANYSIKIGTTSLNELSSFTSGLSTIFSSVSYTEVSGWNTYNFATPFYWDGVSNVVIESCFKNTAWVTSNYGQGPYTTTSFISSLSSYAASSFDCTDTIQDNFYYKRPNVRFTAKGYGSCTSAIVSHQINVVGIPTVDAGVVEIIDPVGTISSSNSESIRVAVKNFGIDTLKSVSINWMDRDMTINTYPWSGVILSGSVDTITIANHTFMGGQTRLYAWTSMPNAVVDTIPNNDTAYTDLDICMQGTYTIGAGMNYPTLQEAIDDMAISSICGAVILDVDTGIYNGKYILPAIVGASMSNNITIKSLGNDSSTVHLTANTTTQDNYVLMLDDAPYVNIEQITVNANGNTYSNAIVLNGNTHHINIRSCVLNSSTNISGTAQASGVYSNDKLVNYVNIENNIINNGYQSIYFKADFYVRHKGITIAHNVLQGFQRDGIFVDYHDSLTIIDNTITSGLLGGTVYGLHIRNTQNSYKIRNNKIIITPTSSGNGIDISGAHGVTSNRAIIANNMITINNGSSKNYGVNLSGVTNTDFVYNSINVLYGNANNIAGRFSLGSGLKIYNNAFYTLKGRIIEVQSSASITACDYNDYYTDTINNPLFIKWNGDVTNLSGLKAVDLSNNVNCISVDPSFYSPTDLHSYEIQLNGAATPISHTTIDFDYETRSTTAPDIGADEFVLSPIDLGVVRLSHPGQSGCGFTSSDSILVQVRNYGTSTIDFSTQPATIVLYSTGVNPDTITFIANSGTVISGAFIDIKVTNSFNLAMTGLYIFDSYITIPGDGNALNNAMPTQDFIYYQAISTFPFVEDFESGNSHYLGSDEGTETQMAVLPVAASTGNYGMRFTGGDNSGFFPNTTVDAAYSHTDHVAALYSCQIDATSLSALNLKLDLKQTYLANSYGSWFRVIVIDQYGAHYAKNTFGDSTFRPLTAIYDPFTTHTFVLDDYTGQVISLYLEAAVGSLVNPSGNGDQVLIDDINIWTPVNTDIAMKAISSFSEGYMQTGLVHYPKIAVENYGASTITSLPISYSVNGQAPMWDTIAVSIGSSQIDTITMNAGITILSGDQELCIIAHLPGDAVPANDTICASIKGLDVMSLDYTDDFESSNKWFAKGTKNQWEYGMPNSTNFTAAHSGVNAYATVLSGDYKTESTEFLYSPYFQIPVTTDTAVFQFIQKMHVQTQLAYGYVQYSFNGQLWLDLGWMGATNSTNWYTTNISGKHSWSNQTSNWVTSSIALDPSTFNVGTNVQFRFVFTSQTAALVSDGWMIDDFSIKLPKQQYDAGVQQIVIPDTSSTAGIATTVEVIIHNYGFDTLLQIPVAYKADLLNEVVENWTGSLLPDSSVSYTFTTPLISPVNTYQLCAYTKLVGDLNAANDGVCKFLNTTAPEWDAAVVDVYEAYQLGGNIVSIVVTNLGEKSISQLPVSYKYGSYQSNVENLASALNKGDTITHTFTNVAPWIVGATLLCGNTLLPNDMIPANDQLCKATTDIDQADDNRFVLKQNQPNPFDNQTQISFSVPRTGDAYFTVVNVVGSIVFEEEYKNVRDTFTKNYDFSFLSPGIYYYSVQYEGRRIVKKMIVR